MALLILTQLAVQKPYFATCAFTGSVTATLPIWHPEEFPSHFEFSAMDLLSLNVIGASSNKNVFGIHLVLITALLLS